MSKVSNSTRRRKSKLKGKGKGTRIPHRTLNPILLAVDKSVESEMRETKENTQKQPKNKPPKEPTAREEAAAMPRARNDNSVWLNQTVTGLAPRWPERKKISRVG
jgi:hypothetical protein